jgi:PIN domain nuclease of toxin-antitoxin system
MRYLLDTHAIIWCFEHSKELPREIEELIDNPEFNIYICAVSLWEIAIKMNLGKLDLKFTLDELLGVVQNRDFNILQIEANYLKKLSDLPYIHNDPFDRLIIATALAEDLPIITIDENIHKYDVKWVW